jgi:hypothetical protein
MGRNRPLYTVQYPELLPQTRLLLSSSNRRAYFKTHKHFGKNKNPRLTVLTRTKGDLSYRATDIKYATA